VSDGNGIGVLVGGGTGVLVGGGTSVGYGVNVGARVGVGMKILVAVAGMRVGGKNWSGVGPSGLPTVLVRNRGVFVGGRVLVAVRFPPIGVKVAVDNSRVLVRDAVPHSKNPAQ
jgi:hypothetical protein